MMGCAGETNGQARTSLLYAPLPDSHVLLVYNQEVQMEVSHWLHTVSWDLLLSVKAIICQVGWLKGTLPHAHAVSFFDCSALISLRRAIMISLTSRSDVTTKSCRRQRGHHHRVRTPTLCPTHGAASPHP